MTNYNSSSRNATALVRWNPEVSEMLILFVSNGLKDFGKLWSGKETVVWGLWVPVQGKEGF